MNIFDRFFDRLSPYAPVVLRVGIGFVFMWFGWGALVEPQTWVSLVPEWVAEGGTAEMLVRIHGAIEFFFGALLLLGRFVKISALVLFLSILNTMFLVSGPTQIRDTGLALATLSILFGKK